MENEKSAWNSLCVIVIFLYCGGLYLVTEKSICDCFFGAEGVGDPIDTVPRR